MISSAGNMRFWLHLCQAAKSPGAEEALQGFSTAAKAGKDSLAAYCHQYNTELMRKVSHVKQNGHGTFVVRTAHA